MGEFEASLIQFERGWRMRKTPQMKTGLMQCKDAILNTVGQNAKPFDKDLVAKVVKEQEKKKQKQLKKSEQRLSGAKTRSQMKKENKKKEQLQRIQDKVLLGQVAPDASFLRGFLEPTVTVQEISDEQVDKNERIFLMNLHIHIHI